MLMDIWARIGEFVCENYEKGLIVGLVLLAVFLGAQIITNESLESELIDVVERIEEIEKLLDIGHELNEKEEEN